MVQLELNFDVDRKGLLRQKRREISRRHYLLHKQEYVERARRWKLANPEKCAELEKKYRKSPASREAKRRWIERNKEYVRIYNLKRLSRVNRLKRRTDPVFKIRELSRGRLNKILRGKGKKPCTTEKLIGCSYHELKLHLEAQFRDGMTWQNHGLRGWHIDHIKPICTFDITNEEELRKCFHYTNLQPLWWHENLAKREFKRR